MYIRRIIFFLVYFITCFLLCNAVLLSTRYGKKNMNSGEIRPRIVKSSSFYVGPRYGKRLAWNPGENTSVQPLRCGIYEELSCDYTGISNYYRCYSKKDLSSDDFATNN